MRKFYKDDILLLNYVEEVLRKEGLNDAANDLSLLKGRIDDEVHSGIYGLGRSLDIISKATSELSK